MGDLSKIAEVTEAVKRGAEMSEFMAGDCSGLGYKFLYQKWFMSFFDGIDSLVFGDTVALRVLNEVLTYEVDQILTVLPEELDALAIEPGQDFVTLLTCTPYGVNSHRLLVRGHRIETPIEKLSEITQDTMESPEEEKQGFLEKTLDSVVKWLSGVVETVAEWIVIFAQWGMDILGIEY
jgi:hypothetical protein